MSDEQETLSAVSSGGRWGKWRYAFGLLLLFGVVAIWVASAELMKFIYSSEETNFSKPFFLTFYNTSMFSLYLLGFACRAEWRKMVPTLSEFRAMRTAMSINANHSAEVAAYVSGKSVERRRASFDDHENYDSPIDSQTRHDHDPFSNGTTFTRTASQHSTAQVEKMTFFEVIRVSVGFCLLWFLANYFYNLAVTLTTVSSVTIISSTSGFFTLILEAIGGHARDRISLLSFLLVGVSVAGVALVSVSDANQKEAGEAPEKKAIGDLIAVLSAFLYGCYLVFLQKKIGNEDRLDMAMFFGFVGLFNVCILWPFFLILHGTGIETFEWPAGVTWAFLTVNAVIGTVLSDYLWLYSTLLTSPLVATLGLSLTIPLAILADAIFYEVHLNVMFVAGTAMVFAAFIGINSMAYQPLMVRAYSLCERYGGERFARVFLGHCDAEVQFGTSAAEASVKYRVLETHEDAHIGMLNKDKQP